jgi:DNA-binding HxlR family transcriptional regulator
MAEGRFQKTAGAEAKSLGVLQEWMTATAGKWALPILDRLTAKAYRYNRLLAELDPISAKVLTQTLRRLEAAGLVRCAATGAIGRSYAITDCGREVCWRLEPLRQFALSTTRAADGERVAA